MILRVCPQIVALVLLLAATATAQGLPQRTFVGQTNAIGVVPLRNYDCTYIIFHDEILLDCPGQSPLPFPETDTVVPYTFLEGRKIITWAKTVDSSDSLYFVAAFEDEGKQSATLFRCKSGANENLQVNVTVSSAGSYANLNNDVVVSSNGQYVLFIGEISDVYGLKLIEEGSFPQNMAGGELQRPQAGNLTNPFFVFDSQDRLFYRAHLNDQPTLFFADPVNRNITKFSTPDAAAAERFQILGPTPAASSAAVALFVVYPAFSQPNYFICNISYDVNMLCEQAVSGLEFDPLNNFAAIVTVENSVYVLANDTLFSPVIDSTEPILGILNVHHDGNPMSLAYVQNFSTLVAQPASLYRLTPSGLKLAHTATVFSPGSDVVGPEAFISFVDSNRVRVGISNATVVVSGLAASCIGSAGSRPPPPGVHATNRTTGETAIVTLTDAGLIVRNWNRATRLSTPASPLRPDNRFTAHAAGLPLTYTLHRKIRDDRFLLLSNVLHSASSVSVFGQTDPDQQSQFLREYITTGPNCTDLLLTIQHMIVSTDGSRIVFTTFNETDPAVLDLWYAKLDIQPDPVQPTRMQSSGSLLYLREADDIQNGNLPATFTESAGEILIVARPGSPNNDSYAYTFIDNNVIRSTGPVTAAAERIRAAPMIGTPVRLAIASDSYNVSIYSPEIMDPFNVTQKKCGSCDVVGIGDSAVAYFPYSSNMMFKLISISEVSEKEADIDRRYMPQLFPRPEFNGQFVVLASSIDGTTWFYQWWSTVPSFVRVSEILSPSFGAPAPIMCGVFRNGYIFSVETAIDRLYYYFSFGTETLAPVESFPLAVNSWCNPLIADNRTIINSATRITVVNMSSPDPVPGVVRFTNPPGTKLDGHVDVYRPFESRGRRLIATVSEVNRDMLRYRFVATMPWNICYFTSECEFGDCINSTCITNPSSPFYDVSPLNQNLNPDTLGPSFSEPQTTPPPAQFQVPAGQPTDPSQPTIGGGSFPIAMGCSNPPPVAGANCVGSTWIIQGNVTVSGTGQVVISSNTIINGTLILSGSNTSVSIGPGATLQVTNCAQFDGSLLVNTITPTATVINSTIPVISFGGFCGGVPTTFSSTRLRFTSEEACATQTTDPTAQYTDRSVSIVFSYDRSGCSSGAASLGLSPGAIAGIVIAILALFAIVAIVLALRFKGVIRPFSGHEGANQKSDNLDSDL